MNIANKISTFRILSVPFFIAALIYYSPQKDYLRIVAIAIFILGVISDAVDGHIARKSKQQSKAGLILDPLGDKLLLMGAFTFLSPVSSLPLHFPLWVTLIIISRDAIILLGALIIYLMKQNIEVHPTRWGKLTTFAQMLSVILLLLQFKFTYIFWCLAVLFTIISGFDYIKRGFKILYAADSSRNSR